MANVVTFQPGGYRFIEHAFQYSGDVAAEPGFAIERARLARMLPLAQGFDAVEAHLKSHGRPPSAFCACELRSPAQFTAAGFVAFNRPIHGTYGDCLRPKLRWRGWRRGVLPRALWPSSSSAPR
jgi:hypothetical protein